ncbi:allophanate hydrolase [Mesorhizobium sp. DCY119]|uniref:allophanate hydrolase n=1 Tax=Mesorhizobium sp. DCY119 TaxID=2108445 RepID=UPI000E749045|nr:allophanate hydrolase [Mesorhizobium sp. DCY119]RJG39876.1 allophanate hydrolase [Mesorhizobium sp. DCY119]
MTLPRILDIASVRKFYAGGATPLDLVEIIIRRMAECPDKAVFITTVTTDGLRQAARDLMASAPTPNALPLWGIPFAVKDNIDVCGLPTTAGCPDFAYEPDRDATTITRLRAAGALVIGKTNLDQFATGLNGTRSPHGAPRCVFNEDYVSGGSSSGSAVAVARGLAVFSLGTDTAGSGRVPAAFNNIVGIKPSPGRVPNTGVVPACRSVDVVTVFATSVADGVAVRRIVEGTDIGDPFSRRFGERPLPASLRLGILAEKDRNFFGNSEYARLYDAAIGRAVSLGATVVPFDYAPFGKAAALLYNGPWVAERLAAIQPFFEAHADSIEPTVRGILQGAGRYSAVNAFNARYELERLRQETLATWDAVDALLLPTSPDIQTVEAMRNDPVALNSRFGLYTNFANLFDCSAIAVPAGFTNAGLAFGVSLIAPQDCDAALASFASQLHEMADCGKGIERQIPDHDKKLLIAVVGAHLRGEPLNHQLATLNGRFVEQTKTSPNYRLYALAGSTPAKPGLIRDSQFQGAGIELEIWELDAAGFGLFVDGIPTPLGIGKITLQDGRQVSGFLCETTALTGSEEISIFGGWRNFLGRPSVV